jgi:NitT/TauT family transport system ATP-binding protein
MLRITMGLEEVSSGSVEVAGKVVEGCGYDRGFVFQHAELLPWRTVLGNVEFGLEVKGVPAKERRETARRNLELVGLTKFESARPHALSGGMQQRVGLVRALTIDPDVLLMDEPFGALDAQTREDLQIELLNIHQKTGKTILFVTHDLDEAVLLADRVILMSSHPGRIKQIFDVPLRRPREDAVALRGTDEFSQIRYAVWKSMRQSAEPRRTVEA